MTPSQRDLPRTLLVVITLGGLIAVSFWVFQPFLPAFVWALMIVISTWPAMRVVEKRLWGRRWLAVTVMVIALLLVFVIPFTFAIANIVAHADEIVTWARSVLDYRLGAAPDWMAGVPFAGPKLVEFWDHVATAGSGEFTSRITPYASGLARWFAQQVGGFGLVAVQFLLTVIISAILYAHGEDAAVFALAFGRRLAGTRGADLMIMAAKAVRGVALGVVVTALAQAVFGGIGLALTGVPAAVMLTAVMFLLAVVQIGAVPVLAAAVIWLYWKDATAASIVLLVWTVITGLLDNVLRPYLIKKGADLPLLLIFAGVVGGLMTLGFVGLFIGPVVLAVTYTLLMAWVAEGMAEDHSS